LGGLPPGKPSANEKVRFKNMRVLGLQAADGLDAVSLSTAPDPTPGPGEVRVALRAAALNHRELWITRGQYPGMVLPATLGADGAGVIDAVGQGVDAALIGQEVVLCPGLRWGNDPRYPAADFGLLGMPGPGTLADAIVVPAASAVAKPPHLDFAAAAAVPLAALTAWRGLVTKAALRPGEKLLVTGAGGGVATFAILLGLAMPASITKTKPGARLSPKPAAASTWCSTVPQAPAMHPTAAPSPWAHGWSSTGPPAA
jgi:NADPH:quinone reductase-like Zn-dependent oxidoreductase